jgi:hypothetical protein
LIFIDQDFFLKKFHDIIDQNTRLFSMVEFLAKSCKNPLQSPLAYILVIVIKKSLDLTTNK